MVYDLGEEVILILIFFFFKRHFIDVPEDKATALEMKDLEVCEPKLPSFLAPAAKAW